MAAQIPGTSHRYLLKKRAFGGSISIRFQDID